MKAVFEYFRNVFRQSYYLFRREIRIRYRRTALSFLWVIIPTFVASLGAIYASRQFNVQDAHTPIYSLKIVLGTMLVQLFTDSFSSAQQVANRCRQFLRFIPYTYEAILVTGVYFALLNFFIKFVFLILGLFVFGIVPPLSSVFYLTGVLFLLCLLGISLAALLIPLSFVYWDIRYANSYLMAAVLVATPVLYPAPTGGILGMVNSFNLLTPLVLLARDSFLGLPYESLSSLVAAPGILMFGFLSILYFRRAIPVGIYHI